MSAPRYKIATLDDIAAIPDEAMPRFLAELPAILRAREQVLEAVPHLAALAKKSAPWPLSLAPPAYFEKLLTYQFRQGGVWVDDGKSTITVSMALERDDPPIYKRTEPLA